jgi:hypothetical protein
MIELVKVILRILLIIIKDIKNKVAIKIIGIKKKIIKIKSFWLNLGLNLRLIKD